MEYPSGIVGIRRGSYQTSSLKWFFGKYGDRFEMADFLAEVDPDGDRGGRGTGPGRTHRCPNDDMHTDAGNPEDKGFFTGNALDSETGQCVGKCMHASCADLDRINFTDLACQAVGIRDATELKKWVPELEGEEEESEKPAQPSDKQPDTPTKTPAAGFASTIQAQEAINSLLKDDDDAAGDVARKIGASPDLAPAAVGGLMKRLAKKSGIGLRSLEAERKIGEKARPAKEDGDDSAIDDEGRAALARWNKKYAVVTMGGKVRILQEPSKPGTMPPLYEIDAFRTLMANDKIPVVTGEGETKQEPLTRLWLEWPERRTYQGGIVFEPAGCRADEHNLWRGFPVEGRDGDWSLLRQHIFENICQADRANFDWLMTWLAQIFQQPGEKLGSTVAIKGKKGTGKSKVFDWVRKAMGQHAIKVSHRKHIVGNFNAHHTGVLLMVCEEAFWAGDAEAGGVLKDIITSNTTVMERKGLDAVEVSNFMRLAMISNEDWIVPAGLDDERRYFVLECGDGRQQDFPFFAAIDKQMERGGLDAMVWELMHWKPVGGDWSVLRDPPKTQWLAEQADQGRSPGERFFLRLAEDGLHECPEEGKADSISTLEICEAGETRTTVSGGRMVQDGGARWVLWPITKLRHHYETFTKTKAAKQAYRRAPGDPEMFRHAKNILGATRRKVDGKTEWQWKDHGKCVAVPMRDVILGNLDERGVVYSRTDCDGGEEEPA